MKALEVSVNSWHFRLATVYTHWTRWGLVHRFESGEFSLCDYARIVFRGFITATLIAAGIGGAISSVADFLMYMLIMLEHDQHFLQTTHFAGVFGLCTVFIVVGVPVFLGLGYLFSKLIDFFSTRAVKRELARAEKPNSFLVEAVKSKLNRYCIPVKVINAK